MNEHVRSLIAEAETHCSAGRLAEAETAYRAALAEAPRHVAILRNLGVVLAAQGKHHGAIGYFQEAANIEPNHSGAHYNLAQTFLALGQTSQATAEFRRTCALE